MNFMQYNIHHLRVLAIQLKYVQIFVTCARERMHSFCFYLSFVAVCSRDAVNVLT